MKRIIMIACTILSCLLIVSATAKPNFNGTWVLDPNRSFSNPPGLEQTMTVVQSDDQIKVDAKIKTQQGEQQVDETYKLDGNEAEFTPPGGQGGAKGKRKATWMPGTRGVVIEDVITSDSPNGPVTRKITRKWTLSPDGAVLTVDYYFDDQRGSFEAKRVFTKKT